MNIQLLKEIGKTEPGRSIATYLGVDGRRARTNTNLRNLQYLMKQGGFTIEMAEIMEFFKRLEKIGVGRIIYGRKGKSPKFYWFYELNTVGKLIIDENVTSEPKKLIPARRIIQEKKEETKETFNPDLLGKLVLTFYTKNGQQIPLNLDEANNLLNQLTQVKAKLSA